MAPVQTVVLGHYDQKKLKDLKKLLTDASLDVFSTSDGESVVQLAAEHKPDLILIDVLMPGINGFEICREVKASFDKKYLPVLLMTDREDAYSRGRGRYVGADDILEYPLTAQKVEEILHYPFEDMDSTGKVLSGEKRGKHDRLVSSVVRDGAPIRPDGLVARITDPLTGLCNKAYMNLKMEEEFKKSRRYGTPLSLIILDVDNFRDIYQENGKSCVKEVLVEIGSVLLCESRDIDIVGRIGESRFLILLPSTDLDGSKVMADRVFNNILERPFEVADSAVGITVTLSMGISSCPRGSVKTVEDFLNMAIRGLNASKENGGNQISIVD
jgi:two-component system, cell cycle response regulator